MLVRFLAACSTLHTRRGTAVLRAPWVCGHTELALRIVWCRRRDSNSHSFRHYPLKIACLPISPRRLHFARTTAEGLPSGNMVFQTALEFTPKTGDFAGHEAQILYCWRVALCETNARPRMSFVALTCQELQQRPTQQALPVLQLPGPLQAQALPRGPHLEFGLPGSWVWRRMREP
jgi:hypothetical protein